MTDLSNDIEKASNEDNSEIREEDFGTMVDDESKATDSVPSLPSIAKKRFNSGAPDDNIPIASMRRASDASYFPKHQTNSTASPSDMNESWNTMAAESNETSKAASLAKDRFNPESEDRAPVNRSRRSSLTEAFARFSLFSKNSIFFANDRFSSGKVEDRAPVRRDRSASLSVGGFSRVSFLSNLSNNDSSLANDRFSTGKTEDIAPVRRDRRASSSELFRRFSIFSNNDSSEGAFFGFISPMSKRLEKTAEEESNERKSTLCCGSCCDVVLGYCIRQVPSDSSEQA